MEKKPSADKLKQLEQEMKIFRKSMAQASDVILDKEVSKYPIFIASQLPIEMGIPLFTPEQSKTKWHIHASTLEEFSTKQIISPEKLDEFRKVFKTPEEELCIFVLSELGATFIFLPRI